MFACTPSSVIENKWMLFKMARTHSHSRVPPLKLRRELKSSIVFLSYPPLAFTTGAQVKVCTFSSAILKFRHSTMAMALFNENFNVVGLLVQ